jgi:SIR2-like domain
VNVRNKGSIALFLGAGASACESFPTVLQFFEHVEFPDGVDARGFKTACMELARRIAIAERTQENTAWPRFDAEKLWGHLELLVNSNKLTNVPFRLPVTRTGGLLTPDAGRVSPEGLLIFLKEQILRIYGRSVSATPAKPRPHQELLALLNKILPADEPISVYTTNYDTVIEDLVHSPSFSETIHSGAQVCTGFAQGNPGRWKPELFDVKPVLKARQIHLFKLHGSVIWKWDTSGTNPDPIEMNWRQPTGDSDCLLYFGYKSVPETDPFRTLHARFKDSLLRSSAVVVIGFQFADPYIRETFDFALRANPQLRLICCLRHNPENDTPLANLIHAFPGRVQILLGDDGSAIAFGEDRFLEALTTALSTG